MFIRGLIIIVISLFLSGCSTVKEFKASEFKASDKYLYKYKCNDNGNVYLSVSKSHKGVMKYKGIGYRLRGKSTVSGAKYITSDNRMVVSRDSDKSLSININNEQVISCQNVGTYEPE